VRDRLDEGFRTGPSPAANGPSMTLLMKIALLRQPTRRTAAPGREAALDAVRPDRWVALAGVAPTLRNVLRIVQPETLLSWHRAGFKALWRSRTRFAPETVALVTVHGFSREKLIGSRVRPPRSVRK